MRNVFLTLFFVVALFGCHHVDYPLVGSIYVPGATGDVQIEKADHGQRLFTVVIDELPAPTKIRPELQAYVLWILPDSADAGAINQGECPYDAKLRQAKCAVATSEKRFRLLLTAEANKDAPAPSETIIAERSVDE